MRYRQYKEDIIKELEELGSTLSGIKTTETTKVPSGYFDGLEDAVMNRLNHSNKEFSIRQIGIKLRWTLAAAASLILLVSTYFLLNNNESTLNTDISVDEIISYLDAEEIVSDESVYDKYEMVNSYYTEKLEELSYEDVEAYISASIDEWDESAIYVVD